MNIEQAAQNPIEDPVVAEVGADPIENNNPIEDLLNAIETQDYTSAESQFNDLIVLRHQFTMAKSLMKKKLTQVKKKLTTTLPMKMTSITLSNS